MVTAATQLLPILFGEGASLQTGAEATKLGMTKALVVCDPGVKGAGVVDPIIKSLHDEGIKTVLYDRVQADSPDFVVEEAGALARKEQVDGAVAVGGGSSMDAAKAAIILINNPSPIHQWFMPAMAPGAGVPLITIPTTAGTGSEVTDVGIITDTITNQKIAALLPPGFGRLAIVDPVAYVGLPPRFTVYCAFDAYTHAIDGIISGTVEPFAVMYAKEAIRLIHENLPRVMEDGRNIEARGGLALAATLAGLTLRGIIAHLTHTIGHSLGTRFHMAHGLGCAVCLPQLLKFYAEALPERTKIAAKAMGLSLPDVISNEELGIRMSEFVRAFMKQCNLPMLKELEYTLEQVFDAVPMMPKDVAMEFAPFKLTEEDYKKIIEDAYNNN